MVLTSTSKESQHGKDVPSPPITPSRGSRSNPTNSLAEKMVQKAGHPSTAFLYGVVAGTSMLSLLLLALYLCSTGHGWEELQMQKLLWWDAWYLGRISEQDVAELPIGCLDFSLNSFARGERHISPDDNERSVTDGTVQPTAAEQEAHASSNIIFLHFNKKLSTFRYLCSVESAAHMNTKHSISIHAENVMDFETKLQGWRSAVGPEIAGRVHIKPLEYDEYFADTPLEEWWKSGSYNNSYWVGQNLGNAYRLAAVYKEGGTYLDMDIISLNSLGAAGRYVAREQIDVINNAALSFPKGDGLLWAIMEEFVAGWNGYLWANNGPYAVTRTFQKKCQKSVYHLGLVPTQTPTPQNKSTQHSRRQSSPSSRPEPTPTRPTHHLLPRAKKLAFGLSHANYADPSILHDHPYCADMNVLRPSRFYPIHYSRRSNLTNDWTLSCGKLQAMKRESLGLHWWHKMVADDELLHRESLLGRVMRTQCPAVVDAYGLRALGIE
ncbi:hypothetical protein SpCBS45565_g04518 [Spizellomyces sp. 'palustris']|nr:hypothetical protein SpCBS45565_g04518 [Spizellomyces sp. 'palustris']